MGELKATIGILGTGSYVPPNIITNQQLEKQVDTSDEWITTRTGIKERRKADEDIATSDLATKAALAAISQANIAPGDISMIIVATVTPDMFFPATACIVQENIGAKNAFAFDISAACTGFVYGLSLAHDYLRNNPNKYALVIGADTLSKITDQEDRGTVVLFGDGAGAAVLGYKENGGILSFDLGSDGSGANLLQVEGGGSRLPASLESIAQRKHYISMNGKEVYKFAVKTMGESSLRALDKAGLSTSDVNCFVPHQANIRIIEGAVKRLGLPMNSVYVNLDRYGNMSGASIPVALDEGIKNARISDGDVVVLVGFGAGLTWGACVLEL